MRHEFPQAKLLVRAYDRSHAVELIHAGVDYQIRETVESAYLMGAQGLRALGCSEAVVSETLQDIRSRDNERLEFLGDRVLGLLVAERLYSDYPTADEGQLSSSLHALVDKAACARVGEALGVGFGEFLRSAGKPRQQGENGHADVHKGFPVVILDSVNGKRL